MAKKGYFSLTTKQQDEFDDVVDKAKTMQSEGKLMFKDLQNEVKKRGGDGLGPMPAEFTENIRKSLIRFLDDKEVNAGLSRAKKEVSDLQKRIRKEYTQIRKKAGFLPERNIGKASGGKIYSKTTIRKVPITD